MPLNHDQTICFKVEKSLEILKHTLKTGEIDIDALSEYLHGIRKDAQRMEDALKLRKEIMTVNKLEDNYQEMKEKETTPPGVNNMPIGFEIRNEPLSYEVIVKDKDKVLYQNNVWGICFSAVEKIDDISHDGVISGKSQQFTVGHDLTVFFAFNQLEQNLEARMMKALTALANTIRLGRLKDATYKSGLLNSMRNFGSIK